MAQLLVRNISEELAKALKQQAAERGVSAEEEHRRILREALAPELAEIGNGRTLFDAIRRLGEIAPDFEIVRERGNWERGETEI